MSSLEQREVGYDNRDTVEMHWVLSRQLQGNTGREGGVELDRGIDGYFL